MDNGGKKEKDHQGTYIKDTWTKPKGGRIKSGRDVRGVEGSGDGKMETTVLEQQ